MLNSLFARLTWVVAVSKEIVVHLRANKFDKGWWMVCWYVRAWFGVPDIHGMVVIAVVSGV